jgi:hypothetical protein
MVLTEKEAEYLSGDQGNLEVLYPPKWRRQRVVIKWIAETFSPVTKGIQQVEVARKITLPRNHGIYELQEDCRFLEQGVDLAPKCTAYNDDRPAICIGFEEASRFCKSMRKGANDSGNYPEWQPIELVPRPESIAS